MLEEQRRQGGQGEIQRVGSAVAGHWCGFDASHIAITSAAVIVRITVAHFLPEPTAWRPNSIVEARDRGEVTHDEYQIIRQVPLA